MQDAKTIATGLRFPEGPVARPDGSLFCVEIERGTVSLVTADGTAGVFAEIGGGPNGLAVGPDGALYVCNNGGFLYGKDDEGINRVQPGVPAGYVGGRIERLDIETRESCVLYDRCGEHRLIGPNDIVFDRFGGFYFTDMGKLYPRFRENGGLYYGLADGSRIVEVAYPMIMPNGVGLSPDGSVVYVAETETARLWAFDLVAPGVIKAHRETPLHGGRLVCGLPGYQRFDSLAVAASGNICVATLVSGCITVVAPDGEVLRQVPTGDPMTTNICFGGDERRTAYVTLSGTGRIAAMDWPEPGLELAFD